MYIVEIVEVVIHYNISWNTCTTYLFMKKIDLNKILKRTLFNQTRQYNIQVLDKIIFFKYMTRRIKTTETNKKVTYANL